MRSEVKRTGPVAKLERLLEALGEELAEASDEEVLQAWLEEVFDHNAIPWLRQGVTDPGQGIPPDRWSPGGGPTRGDRAGGDEDAEMTPAG